MDGAARQFSEAYDQGLLPNEFVNEMRKKHTLIMGIGHRVKSVSLCACQVASALKAAAMSSPAATGC